MVEVEGTKDFTGTGEAYDRFMGRYSHLLAPLFADFCGVEQGQRLLDVGCGPGAFTACRGRAARPVGRSWPSTRRRASWRPVGSATPTSTSGPGRPRTCRSTTRRSTGRSRSW